MVRFACAVTTLGAMEISLSAGGLYRHLDPSQRLSIADTELVYIQVKTISKYRCWLQCVQDSQLLSVNGCGAVMPTKSAGVWQPMDWCG